MTLSLPRTRRILYVGSLGSGSTAAYRYESLKRLRQQTRPCDMRQYSPKSRAMQWLRTRYPMGPLISRVNCDLLKAVQNFRPEIVWFDKPTVFTPETMRAIHASGAKIVFYVQDAPFGPRNDGCWMQFLKTYRMADLHCLVRKADAVRYRAWGLPFIETMFSFDPVQHFPAAPGWSNAEPGREVSYIGFPYEQRPAFLLELAHEHKLSIFINGNRWRGVFTAEELHHFHLGEYLSDDQYREGIWKSKINLSFVTEDNEDDIAHKAVEIAACGGFLLALRTPGHQALFEEDHEAVFFSSVDECADKCRFYLARPHLREAIAARGRGRAVRSGYDNDTQLARILNRLDGKES